jgi:hypothetical protein
VLVHATDTLATNSPKSPSWRRSRNAKLVPEREEPCRTTPR